MQVNTHAAALAVGSPSSTQATVKVITVAAAAQPPKLSNQLCLPHQWTEMDAIYMHNAAPVAHAA